MRTSSTAWHRAAWTAAAVGAALALLAASNASAVANGDGAAHGKNPRACLRLHVTEKMIKFDTSLPPAADLPVGFMSTWFDELYDASGAKIATATGNMDIMYARPSDGHKMQFQMEQVQLPDGTFSMAGPFDRTDVIESNWITAPVVGLSGRYAGWKGTWVWRTLPVPPGETAPPFEDKIVLCGP
ncbi:allene oxide cyclase barrel-like domain-containing protein [Streptomyces sp. NRRL F-525]|uniref:allene oxide cyclase barrel-like domain-containing protein n=1 Tax=Streptomyces sp. NRRL F-525 TaxID=1463861 RepID=UPI0005243C7F|nr:hypothetical protein [Streptomyces sp. NRRL F-525]